ncbi:carbohydrate kinase family protein [Fibrella arboris]|uniref:carbohydrate kinase family protein n=1 Tax=Fibrella arboris TaxID=3242486 RepID=UPI003522230E
MTLTSKQLILSVGELLADFIGQSFSESLFDAADFSRFQGGSPANMAANMARLGNQAALVACVGDDNLGAFLIQKVAETGIDVSHIAVHDSEPTSLVVVSRTKGTPDFIAYRTADCQLHPNHLSDQLLDQVALFHTTCFALSRKPAQDTIVDAARRAAVAGAQISIDANYAPSIWPDRDKAWQVLTDYCSLGTLVKLSEDDAERLYGSPQTPEQVRSDFHKLGAKLVCMTLGAEGSIVSTNNGDSVVRIPGKPLAVVDATGAGDAYWAGFLTAWLDGCTPAECAGAGASLAAMKLVRRGSLPPTVDRKMLYDV